MRKGIAAPVESLGLAQSRRSGTSSGNPSRRITVRITVRICLTVGLLAGTSGGTAAVGNPNANVAQGENTAVASAPLVGEYAALLARAPTVA
jgi:hypothetical protein